jgi:L-amino acid N-acyltransferase YncA
MAIREATEADFARIAQLISATQPEPVTESDVLEWEVRRLAGQIRRRMVIVSQTGQIDGYSLVQHIESMGEGRFYLWVTVDLTRRQRGIGAGAYDEALAFALAQGATVLESEVREECDEGLGFAARRGFAVNRHLFESAIDLASFDESLFAGLAEMVQAGGIRFLSLADVDMDPDYFRQLYEVNFRAVEDDPGSTSSAESIITNNDSQNAPMLAINRKLGYVPRPGIFRLVRPVRTARRPS